jgi:hypothetical protein
VTAYRAFLDGKAALSPATGIADPGELKAALYPFQHDIVAWALRRGRAAIFANCGLGKTLMQLAWAEKVPGRVLVVAPLAVSEQTVREGARFGIPCVIGRRADVPDARIVVTNYEQMQHFDPAAFTGIVLDESSILKSYDGATRTMLIEMFGATPFRLACTATPAPNDFMELGNHSEFLGVLTRAEMLATFFVHDGGETQKWRVKRHAVKPWWRWVASWAAMLRMPSDLGYSDDGFLLRDLRYHEYMLPAPVLEGEMFASEAMTLHERIGARRETVSIRVARAAELVNADPSPWLVWCDRNDEHEALCAAIPGAVGVRGSDDAEVKTERMLAFADGRIRVLVTKPSIAGFGMNWQHCARMAFVGLSDSYEQFYQAVRRCWRFGQTMPVDVHVVTTDSMGRVRANIERKDEQAAEMAGHMIEHMRDITTRSLHGGSIKQVDEYRERVREADGWKLYLGDCVESTREIETGSIDYSIFSPPFASLYTYTSSDRDMGNARNHAEFYEHFGFLVPELLRVTRPGRLLSFHCMNIPTSKARDGVIGLRDFRGELIRMFSDAGWIYHSEVCIWKDPVTAMHRTKALGLLYKQLKKDSAMSRQGIADYLVTMRAPGENDAPVTKTPDDFPVSLWQRYASPVWMDIDPNDTLQYRSAREAADERHICPLQLPVIRRAIELWTNPGDLVLSPFAGIGSEGVIARELGRRFVGVELKAAYWRQAVANLEQAHAPVDLFSAPVA